jgi:AcrR family transcriptional regulator
MEKPDQEQGPTKERIRRATADLLRVQGYAGTGLKSIAAEARAPFGSIYHFFPGGKEQLAEDVIRESGAAYGDLFELLLGPAPDLLSGVTAAFDGAAQTLLDTGFADACPIATVALEVANTNEVLRRATADVFDGWVEKGIPQFTRWGIDAATARTLALAVIINLEGAFVLARAHRSVEPLQVAGATVRLLCQSALDGRSDPRPG